MKKILSLMVQVVVAALLPFALFASDSAEVAMELTARFVELPGAPYFAAKGSGSLEYEKLDGEAVFDNGSLPEMAFETDDAPADLSNLKVVVSGMLGTSSKLTWKDYPTIDLGGLCLNVKAFDSSPHPIFEKAICGIDLSTREVEAYGVSSGGYIDLKDMEAQLAGTLKLPDDDSFPPYAEHLAGKTVILELLVRAEK
jgi:hypothetical protein